MRARITSVDTIAQWSTAYQFPQRIHASPNQEYRIRSETKHRAAVFEAYVGAVFYSEDLQRVRSWLRPLIECVLQDVDDRRQSADSDEEEDDDEVDDGETETATTRTTPTGSPFRSPHEVILPGIRNMLLGSDLASQISYGSSPMDRMSLLHPPAAAPMQPPYGLTTADVHASAPGVNRYPSISNLSEGSSHQSSIPPTRPPHGITTADVRASAPGVNRYPGISNLSEGSSHQSSIPPTRPPHGITTADVHALGGGRFASMSVLSELPSGLKFHPHGTPSTSNPTPPSGNHPLTPVSLPQSSPPPRPSSAYTTATAPPSGGYLALFNQLASQKHIEPEWIATSSGGFFLLSILLLLTLSQGPAHRPTFNAIVKSN